MRTEASLRVAALLAFSLTIGGCGLKGDLYLPPDDEPDTAQTEPTGTDERDDEPSGDDR